MTKPKAQKPQLPASGGSYTAASDGALTKVEATQPKPSQAAPKADKKEA